MDVGDGTVNGSRRELKVAPGSVSHNRRGPHSFRHGLARSRVPYSRKPIRDTCDRPSARYWLVLGQIQPLENPKLRRQLRRPILAVSGPAKWCWLLAVPCFRREKTRPP